MGNNIKKDNPPKNPKINDNPGNGKKEEKISEKKKNFTGRGDNSQGKKPGGSKPGGNSVENKLAQIGKKIVSGGVAGVSFCAEVICSGVEKVGDAINDLKNNQNLREAVDKGIYYTCDIASGIDFSDTFKPKLINKKKKGNYKLNEIRLAYSEQMNKNKLKEREVKEMEEKIKKTEEEEEKKNNLIMEGNKEWENYKDHLSSNIIKKINYLDLIDENILNIYYEFKQKISEETKKIFDENFKALASELIREKHNLLYQSIKDNIVELQSLNFIVAGFKETGKTTLKNALLKIEQDIEENTEEIKPYTNPEKVPGITIYDTVGVNSLSVNRTISDIKREIMEKFEEYLQNPEKAIHGILYCIKNGLGDLKIPKEQIQYIKELNKLYGEGDILIIVFTQSTNTKAQTNLRKNELSEKLNNENIPIVSVLAKSYNFEINDQVFEIKAKGLDILYNTIKEKCKNSLIKYNIKKIVKKKIKEKYLENINKIYIDIRKRLREHKIESSFAYRCKYILENLLGEFNLDYKNIEKIANDLVKKLQEKLMKSLKFQYEEKIRNDIKRQFTIINAKYDNLLRRNFNDYEMYIFNHNFQKYMEPKIKEELEKRIFERVMILFMENSIEIISEIISDNVPDKEIKDLVELNIENLFQKINI